MPRIPREVVGSSSANLRKDSSASWYLPCESWPTADWKRASAGFGAGCWQRRTPQHKMTVSGRVLKLDGMALRELQSDTQLAAPLWGRDERGCPRPQRPK